MPVREGVTVASACRIRFSVVGPSLALTALAIAGPSAYAAVEPPSRALPAPHVRLTRAPGFTERHGAGAPAAAALRAGGVRPRTARETGAAARGADAPRATSDGSAPDHPGFAGRPALAPRRRHAWAESLVPRRSPTGRSRHVRAAPRRDAASSARGTVVPTETGTERTKGRTRTEAETGAEAAEAGSPGAVPATRPTRRASSRSAGTGARGHARPPASGAWQDGRSAGQSAEPPTGRVLRVLPMGTGLALLGMGIGVIGLRLRRP